MSVTSREYSTQIPTQQAKFLAASLFLYCSTQVQAFSIISYKQSSVPIKAWKESLSSATSENHTWTPSLSSRTCFEMQGRPALLPVLLCWLFCFSACGMMLCGVLKSSGCGTQRSQQVPLVLGSQNGGCTTRWRNWLWPWFSIASSSELTLSTFCYFSSWRLSAWWSLEECVQGGDRGTSVS